MCKMLDGSERLAYQAKHLSWIMDFDFCDGLFSKKREVCDGLQRKGSFPGRRDMFQGSVWV